MKIAVTGLILSIVLIINMLTHYSISDKDIRKRELENGVTSAVRQTVESVKMKEMYEYNNVEQVIAEFTRTLLMTVDSNSTITVRVLGVDHEEGFLDVEVTADFMYPNGNLDQVKVRKSIIYEAMPNND